MTELPSELWARLRVRETSGIRRFLYPLTAYIFLSVTLKPGEVKSIKEMYEGFTLKTVDGRELPRQFTPLTRSNTVRLDFALSLAPGEVQDLVVTKEPSSAVITDPLQVAAMLDGGLKNTQAQFTIALDFEGTISEVVHTGVRHLRAPSRIKRNEEVAWHSSSVAMNHADQCPLYADLKASSRYKDGCFAQTNTSLTACKSWAMVTHKLEQPRPNDEIVFTLPLAVTSSTLICDFGVGGYVFGKLDTKATEVVWHTDFGMATYAEWRLVSAGRVDYVGEVDTAEAFLPQRWFHLIDSDKALAVAITKLPESCQSMTVRLTSEGDVSIAFKLGERASGPAEFGVCYHFLNDVPAIAAATNPQSILLPPVVEVL